VLPSPLLIAIFITIVMLFVAIFSVIAVASLLLVFFLPYDIIVLDKGAIHTGKGNSILGDWLWDNYQICLLLLPALALEWNPLELMWNILAQQPSVFRLHLIQKIGSHSLVQASEISLWNSMHAEVDGCYREYGV
jgi:hypothetical protein